MNTFSWIQTDLHCVSRFQTSVIIAHGWHAFTRINANPLILKILRSTINLAKIFSFNSSLIKLGQIKHAKSFFVVSGGKVKEKQTAYFTL